MSEFRPETPAFKSFDFQKSSDAFQSEATDLLNTATSGRVQPLDQTEQNQKLVKDGTLPDVNIDFGNEIPSTPSRTQLNDTRTAPNTSGNATDGARLLQESTVSRVPDR